VPQHSCFEQLIICSVWFMEKKKMVTQVRFVLPQLGFFCLVGWGVLFVCLFVCFCLWNLSKDLGKEYSRVLIRAVFLKGQMYCCQLKCWSVSVSPYMCVLCICVLPPPQLHSRFLFPVLCSCSSRKDPVGICLPLCLGSEKREGEKDCRGRKRFL
jgi:hypothetical protein